MSIDAFNDTFGFLYDRNSGHMAPFDPKHFRYGDVGKIWIHKPMYEIVYKSIIVAIIVLIGLTGNFLVIFLVLKRPQIRQLPINIFIVNLAIADFLTLLFTPCVGLINSIFQNYELGPVMCKLEILIKMMCILASNFSVVAISLHRFININHARLQAKSCSCTLLIIIIIWIFSIGLTLPLSFYRHYHERQWKDYLEKWCCDDPPEQSQRYWIFLMSPLLYIPLIIMIIVYSLMIFKINRFIGKLHAGHPPEAFGRVNRAMSLGGVSTLSVSPNWSALPEDKRQASPLSTINQEPTSDIYLEANSVGSKLTTNAPEEQHKVLENPRKSVMVTICIYCGTTLILWLPLQVLVYYRAFRKLAPMSEWYDQIKFIAQILCAVNAALNPFITFRKTFSNLFKQFYAKRKQAKTVDKINRCRARGDYDSSPNIDPDKSNEKWTKEFPLLDNTLTRSGKRHDESWIEQANREELATGWSKQQSEHPPNTPLVLTREVLRKCEQVASTPVPVAPPELPTQAEPASSTEFSGKTLIPTTSLTKRVLLKYVPEIFTDHE